MKNGENVIYYCQFDTVGKSYDELSDISDEAFETLKLALEKTPAFIDSKRRSELLKIFHSCIGIATSSSAALAVDSDCKVRLTAESFDFSESSEIFLSCVSFHARSMKIGIEAQKCVIFIEV